MLRSIQGFFHKKEALVVLMILIITIVSIKSSLEKHLETNVPSIMHNTFLINDNINHVVIKKNFFVTVFKEARERYIPSDRNLLETTSESENVQDSSLMDEQYNREDDSARSKDELSKDKDSSKENLEIEKSSQDVTSAKQKESRTKEISSEVFSDSGDVVVETSGSIDGQIKIVKKEVGDESTNNAEEVDMSKLSVEQRLEKFKKLERERHNKEKALKEQLERKAAERGRSRLSLNDSLALAFQGFKDDIAFQIKKNEYVLSENNPWLYSLIFGLGYLWSENTPAWLKSLIISILCVLLYSCYCYPLMKLAQQFEIGYYFLAWIPIGQELLLFRMAKFPMNYFLWYLIPGLNILAILRLWWEILDVLNEPRFLAFLMLVPGLNFIPLWYLSRE